MRLARESIRQRSDFVGGHRVLTAAAGMAGDSELATVRPAGAAPRAAQYLAGLGREPDAGREPAERAHYLEAFRRAGLQ